MAGAKYIEKNTIQIRRIAEQNQLDMKHTQKQAEIAQRSAETMERIAQIGMVFLPATLDHIFTRIWIANPSLKNPHK